MGKCGCGTIRKKRARDAVGPIWQCLARTSLLAAIGALLAACAGGQAGPTKSPSGTLQSLDPLLAFAAPAKCRPGKLLERLYESMVWLDKANMPQPRSPMLPPEYQGAVGAPIVAMRAKDHTIIEAPVRGRWLGLPVSAIAGLYGHQSDLAGVIIAFAAPQAQVRDVLQRQGFVVDGTRPGTNPHTGTEKAGVAMLKGDAQTTRLTCDWSL